MEWPCQDIFDMRNTQAHEPIFGEIAIVIEYNASRSVILLINEKLSGLFIEMSSRKPKSIPPVVVSSALSLTMVSYPKIRRSFSFSFSFSLYESNNGGSPFLHHMHYT